MKPNIAVLLLDAARVDRLSCYGYERATTPFLNDLVGNATQYTRAYSSSIWSLPAYASLFTGEYPSEHGAIDWSKSISKNILVDEINAAGYDSFAVSPHVVTGSFGFSDAFSKTINPTPEYHKKWEGDDAVKDIIGKVRSNEWSTYPKAIYGMLKSMYDNHSIVPIPYGALYSVEKMKRQLGRWGDDGANDILAEVDNLISKNDSPFFLFANFIETHAPYRPPKEYRDQFVSSEFSIGELNSIINTDPIDLTLGNRKLTDRECNILSSLYDSEIRYIDDKIKEFYDMLDDYGLRNNTIVVITADHGDLFGEHGVWGHQAYLHNRLAHVPLIIDYPWKNGEEVEEIVETRLLCDHLIEMAQSEYPPKTNRISSSQEAIIEYYGWGTQLLFDPSSKIEDDGRQIWGSYQSAAINHSWKYLWSTQYDELFNIESDPVESTSIDIDENLDTTETLRTAIKDSVGTPSANIRKHLKEDDSEEMEEELKSHLEDLGYA